MKKRRKREKRRKIDKKMMALLLVVVFFIIIVVYQTTRETPKYSAEEYFEILEPTPGGTLNEDWSHLFLYSLTFKIKAVRGDAHEVIANSAGLGMEEPMWVGTIMNGEERTVFLSFERFPISLRLEGE